MLCYKDPDANGLVGRMNTKAIDHFNWIEGRYEKALGTFLPDPGDAPLSRLKRRNISMMLAKSVANLIKKAEAYLAAEASTMSILFRCHGVHDFLSSIGPSLTTFG